MEMGVHLSGATIVDPNRRDFLFLATGAASAVGVAAVAWPLIDQMNPDASTLALAAIEGSGSRAKATRGRVDVRHDGALWGLGI